MTEGVTSGATAQNSGDNEDGNTWMANRDIDDGTWNMLVMGIEGEIVIFISIPYHRKLDFNGLSSK